MLAEGTVTYGAQTHPADGNAGLVVSTAARARELAQDPSIRIELRGFGESRTARGMMPQAPLEAARRDAELAGGGGGGQRIRSVVEPGERQRERQRPGGELDRQLAALIIARRDPAGAIAWRGPDQAAGSAMIHADMGVVADGIREPRATRPAELRIRDVRTRIAGA